MPTNDIFITTQQTLGDKTAHLDTPISHSMRSEYNSPCLVDVLGAAENGGTEGLNMSARSREIAATRIGA